MSNILVPRWLGTVDRAGLICTVMSVLSAGYFRRLGEGVCVYVVCGALVWLLFYSDFLFFSVCRSPIPPSESGPNVCKN